MDQKIKKLKKRLRETEASLRKEIKKRKEAEKAFKRHRETFIRALKEMPVIIFAKDGDGSLIFFNREFELVSGYSAEDLAKDPEILQDICKNEEKGLPVEYEFEGESNIQSKSGEKKYVYWSSISEHFPIPGWDSWKVGINITNLKATQNKVKILSGLLPICANCKNVRDDKGYWNQIEGYIQEHSEAEFSHGICPTCAKKLYPSLYEGKK